MIWGALQATTRIVLKFAQNHIPTKTIYICLLGPPPIRSILPDAPGKMLLFKDRLDKALSNSVYWKVLVPMTGSWD